ncbi:hypothetical protein ZIOFF_021647 [Zingiber officinale]|uniref:Uncharacterized protein n=1 Tax=Zingiber officinale TaxID=94328 RepID=A0A8J5H464_ZINOF|nr:hypothetical protein ZIOFF_021647 [Zingiber officinale]
MCEDELLPNLIDQRRRSGPGTHRDSGDGRPQCRRAECWEGGRSGGATDDVRLGREEDLVLVARLLCTEEDEGDQKQLCETGLGLVSQRWLTKHVFRISKLYLANVGGRGTVLVDALSRHIPLVIASQD